MKTKLNYVELTGYLVKDPIIKNNFTFIRIATWNGKSEKTGQDYGTQFTNIAFYNKDLSELKKGDRAVVKGKLTTVKGKSTGFEELGIFGWSCSKVKKENNESEPETSYNSEEILNIPWDINFD